MRGGDLAELSGFPMPALAKTMSILPFALDRSEKAVEVVETGPSPRTPVIRADQLDGLVERFLPAAEDEDEGAFFNEALCRGEPMPVAPPVITAVFPSNLVIVSVLVSRRSSGTSPRPEHGAAEVRR